MRIREQRKRERMRELQRMADHVCSLILVSDYPEIDIEIEKSTLRLSPTSRTEFAQG